MVDFILVTILIVLVTSLILYLTGANMTTRKIVWTLVAIILIILFIRFGLAARLSHYF